MSDKEYAVVTLGIIVFTTLWIVFFGTILGHVASGLSGICIGYTIAAIISDLRRR